MCKYISLLTPRIPPSHPFLAPLPRTPPSHCSWNLVKIKTIFTTTYTADCNLWNKAAKLKQTLVYKTSVMWVKMLPTFCCLDNTQLLVDSIEQRCTSQKLAQLGLVCMPAVNALNTR